jgi:CO/xanthine dehydrogenase FAD-binding subunit
MIKFNTNENRPISIGEVKLQAFDYQAASSIGEVLTLLSDSKRQMKIFSGGTDLLIQLREGRQQADLIVDIKKIPELVEVVYDPLQGLRIGAAASCFKVCHNAAVTTHYPGLVDAISLIGGVQIQNRASIGGNLCNASPAADTIPALIVHNAVCLIRGPLSRRSVPVEQFCTAPGKTILQPDEFLEAIHIPPPRSHFGAHYLRFIPRNEMDIAVVGVGVAVIIDGNQSHFQAVRLALASVAPTPLYVSEVGDFLRGKEISSQVIKEAALIAQAAARPISDLRGTAEQRLHLTPVLTCRALEKAIERAKF